MRVADIYTIMDLVAKAFGPLVTHKHSAVAIRQFHDVANTPKTGIHEHPDDYALIKIAEIHEDDETGMPTIVGTGRETILSGKAWRIQQEAANSPQLVREA